MKKENLLAPISGEVINLSRVDDPVFAQKTLGEGFAIKPEKMQLVSPVTGKIMMVAETKHAIGFKTATGMEVLIHLGIDTVELEGKPFSIEVAAGTEVEAGQKIGTMDLAAIKTAGKDDVVVVAVTNTAEILSSIDVQLGKIDAGQVAAEVTLKEDIKTKPAANAKENKYQVTAREVVEAIGGSDNIKSVIHCFTRLRFSLKDDSIPDDDQVNQISGVLDVARANNQYQVVIGQTVDDVYDEVIKILGPQYAGQGQEADDSNNSEHDNQDLSFGGKIKNAFFQLIGVITGSMMPVIGLLAASGMLKGILNILTNFCHMSTASPTYTIINSMGDAAFYFLPMV